ncbi:hypothetical protein UMM65_10130 [Aureibaculum sp. 2210JD6-5]|uniref:hypothetical protein n=1 Tax=Aureibaculum sp. 2210JD6-5 TaxID=3103957 RepID=UPI002AACB441|nr:hypothetical protein [Aureibaculum sp. 2210JD6-5]MDY7395600.1 hypothetical protein [Aureibaculum sp. 2210JD6-5]
MNNNEYLDLGKVTLIDSFISEKTLSERISISSKDNSLNFNLFANLIQKPVGYDEFSKYKGFHITFETLREHLGFEKNKKPGDFDILLIPFSDEKIYFERCCAIEIKVVRPNRKNPKKAPNSYGIKQINGLIKDGFPLIGLIHICMTEPLKENEKQTIKLDLTPFDMDNPANNDKFMESTINVKYDHFSQYSAENQMKKLLSKDIPKYIGLITVGVNLTDKGKLLTSFNHDFNNGYSSGYFNPYKKLETINKIESFFTENKDKFQIAKK